MSLIKLAYTPVIVVNNQGDPNAASSRGLNLRNVGTTAAGTLSAFGTRELIEHHLPKFDKTIAKHRFGSHIGTAAAGFLGAATAYKVLQSKRKNQDPQIYMM